MMCVRHTSCVRRGVATGTGQGRGCVRPLPLMSRLMRLQEECRRVTACALQNGHGRRGWPADGGNMPDHRPGGLNSAAPRQYVKKLCERSAAALRRRCPAPLSTAEVHDRAAGRPCAADDDRSMPWRRSAPPPGPTAALRSMRSVVQAGQTWQLSVCGAHALRMPKEHGRSIRRGRARRPLAAARGICTTLTIYTIYGMTPGSGCTFPLT